MESLEGGDQSDPPSIRGRIPWKCELGSPPRTGNGEDHHTIAAEIPSAFASRCRPTMVHRQTNGEAWMKELRTVAEVLERLSHNQEALRASVEELAKWVGERGSDAVVGNVNGALATMDDNTDAVRQGIAELVAASVK